MKKILIGTIIVSITCIIVICSSLYFYKQYLISTFVHNDIDDITFDYNRNNHMFDYYFGYYEEDINENNKSYKKYYAALIDFPDKKIFIEENRLYMRTINEEDYRFYTIVYVKDSLKKEKEKDYLDYYLDATHDSSCMTELKYYKHLGKNYYYVIYDDYSEC